MQCKGASLDGPIPHCETKEVSKTKKAAPRFTGVAALRLVWKSRWRMAHDYKYEAPSLVGRLKLPENSYLSTSIIYLATPPPLSFLSAQIQSTTSSGLHLCQARAFISSRVIFCVYIIWESFFTPLIEGQELAFKWHPLTSSLTSSRHSESSGRLREVLESSCTTGKHCQQDDLSGGSPWIACTWSVPGGPANRPVSCWNYTPTLGSFSALRRSLLIQTQSLLEFEQLLVHCAAINLSSSEPPKRCSQ